MNGSQETCPLRNSDDVSARAGVLERDESLSYVLSDRPRWAVFFYAGPPQYAEIPGRRRRLRCKAAEDGIQRRRCRKFNSQIWKILPSSTRSFGRTLLRFQI